MLSHFENDTFIDTANHDTEQFNNMKTEQYPALFRNADAASARRQRSYFRLLFAQYALLLLASIITLSNFSKDGVPEIALYLIFVTLASVLLLKSILQAPEKEWYSARALAESIKTLTWRYMMGSDPFFLEKTHKSPEVMFTDYLTRLTELNNVSAHTLVTDMIVDNQITSEMERIRNLPLDQRREVYLQQRIQDQLNWYVAKAQRNYKLGTSLNWACVAIYVIAIALAVVQFFHTNNASAQLTVKWATEPVLVLAASTLGWIQAKRYSELAASYTLAVHEITKIRERLSRVQNQDEFAEFVLESESAFSREHTQWVAKQTSNIV